MRTVLLAALVLGVGCGKKNKSEPAPGPAEPETTEPATPDPSPETVAATDQSGGVVMVPGLPPQPLVPEDEDAPKKTHDVAVVAVTIAGGAIYFLDQRVQGVVRQPIVGGKPKLLAEFPAAMQWASAGDKSLFFIAGSSVRSVPLAGGKLATVVPSLANPRGVAADGDGVYVVYGASFGAPASGPDGVVARYGADGKPTVVAEAQAGPIAVAVDGTHVYWTVKGALMRAPKAGGDAEVLAPFPEEYAWHLALSDTHAYVTVQGNAGTYISQVAKADGAVKQLARLHNQPIDIAFGDKLYFTAESATPGVATLWSFDPADSKLASVATGLTGRPYLEANATHVAWANADTVYWLAYGETTPNKIRFDK